MSYRDKDAYEIASDLNIPGYFMVTQCFKNTKSDLDVEKCQFPSENEVEDTLPVTSSKTGRVYWNSYCARCNNDGSDIMYWNSSVKFDFNIAFFVNETNTYGSAYPETPDGILEFISETGDIVYVPPNSIEENMCFRKNTLYTCTIPRPTVTVIPWLSDACEQFYSPMLIENDFGRMYPFLNVFCYLCRRQYLEPNDNDYCGDIKHQYRDTPGKLTAVLDYRALSHHNAGNSNAAGSRDEACDCDEIYDKHFVSSLCSTIFWRSLSVLS